MSFPITPASILKGLARDGREIGEGVQWEFSAVEVFIMSNLKPAFRRDVILFSLMSILSPVCSFPENFTFFEPLSPPRPFQVMVHRGAAGQAPENTAPALQRCIEDGFEWAEVDVRLTKDGKHILAHDAKLERISDGKGPVKERTLDEIKKLDAGSWFAKRYVNQHLLSLDECFVLAKGKLNLYLDCKDVNAELLAQQILAAGMEKQVVVFNDLGSLRTVSEASQAKVAVMPKWHPMFGTDDWIDKLQPAAVEVDANEVTPELCSAFHQKHVKVQAKVLGGEWDRPEVWDKLHKAGVDWFQTDLPEELIAHLTWQRIPKRPVRISLHRGANRYAPENTIPAFEKAIRLGTDFVEFDVRTTKDNKSYLLHDGKLDRTTTGRGNLAETTSDVLNGLDAGSWFGKPFIATTIPTLDDFLSAVKDKVDLYFDAKDITPEALSEAVERHHMAERTVVYEGIDFLMKLKAINPKIRALPSFDDPAELDSVAEKLKPYALDTKWEILSKEFIDRCHSLGILVFSDSLGRHEKVQDFLQAMDWGIDLIQTDHPMRLIRAIELREANSKPKTDP